MILSIRRFIGLGTDLLILSLITIAIFGTLDQVEYIELSPKVSTIILWSWLFYFVLFDWITGATLGKLLVVLRVVKLGGNCIGFMSSFGRTMLTLVVPIILSSLFFYLAGNLSVSRLRFLIAHLMGWTSLLIVPVSSIVFGGMQGIPDYLLNTAVMLHRSAIDYPHIRIDRHKWLLTCFLSLLIAFIPSAGAYFIEELQGRWTNILPRIQEFNDELAPSVNSFMKNLTIELKDTHLNINRIGITSEKNFLKLEEDPLFPPIKVSESLAQQKTLPVIEMQLSPKAGTFVRTRLVEIFSQSMNLEIPIDERPFFILMKLKAKKDFGIFWIEREESLLFCFVDFQEKPVSFYLVPNPGHSMSILFPFDYLRAILLGQVEP